MFSFLTGKKDDVAEAGVVANAPTSGTATAEAPEPVAGALGSPFTPPAAWGIDTSALTAPVAKAAAEAPKVGPGAAFTRSGGCTRGVDAVHCTVNNPHARPERHLGAHAC